MDALRRIAVITVVGITVGGIAACSAVLFVDAILWLNEFLHVAPGTRDPAAASRWSPLALVAVPTIGGLLVGLLVLASGRRRPLSLPDAIHAAQSWAPAIPARPSLLTAIAAMLSLGTGASVGQYGPLAHLGASIGAWIGRLTGNDRHLRRIGIACGAAAAISAAFNAPIAGVLFAHEVILRHFSLRAFAPVTVAAVIGYVVSHVVFQRPHLFRIEDVLVANPSEYVFFVLIGVAGAILAVIFMHLVLRVGDFADRLAWPVPLKTAFAGLCVGIVALQIPEILGIGIDVLRVTVTEHSLSPGTLALIMIAKILLTALCLGFGFAGGVFSPALLIGALFGSLFGAGAGAVFSGAESHVAIYAICGMVAVTGPVIGAPLTMILIVLELTQNYELTIASVLSVAFANLVGYRVFGRSIFDVLLERRGLDFSFGRDKIVTQQQSIRPLLSSEFTRVDCDTPLTDVRDRLIRDKRSEAYVVGEDRRFVGIISLHELVENLVAHKAGDERADACARRDLTVLRPDDSIWDAMHRIRGFVGESIPVVEDDVLVGVLFEATIVSAYVEALKEIRREEQAAA